MKKYNIPIPPPRGMVIQNISIPIQTVDSNQNNTSAVRDIIIHAAVCRIAYSNNHTEEFLAKFDQDSGILDIDIPDELLDYVENVSIGPKLARYFSWLTNGFVNMRRQILQFTIASNQIIPGTQGIGLQIPADGTIERIDVLATSVCDVVVDLWKVSPEFWPGTSNDSIVGDQKLTLAQQSSSIDAPIDRWDKTVSYGDMIVYNVESANNAQFITITIHMLRKFT